MSTTQKTRTVAGHRINLTAGRRYLAGRPICTATVIIRDITDETGHRSGPDVLKLELATRQEADKFLRAFNNEAMSFTGRV